MLCFLYSVVVSFPVLKHYSDLNYQGINTILPLHVLSKAKDLKSSFFTAKKTFDELGTLHVMLLKVEHNHMLLQSVFQTLVQNSRTTTCDNIFNRASFLKNIKAKCYKTILHST